MFIVTEYAALRPTHMSLLIFFFRSDGSFVINGVASGSYVVEVSNPDYIFEASRVDITAKGIQVTLHSQILHLFVSTSENRPVDVPDLV